MGEDAGPLEATSTGMIGSIDLKGSEIAYNKVHDVTGLPVSDGNYNKQKIVAFYMEDIENYTAHHNLIYNFKADNYKGNVTIGKVGEFLYLGPRYNRMQKPVNYYNNTIWNYDQLLSIWHIGIENWQELGIAEEDAGGSMEDGHFANNVFVNQSLYRLGYTRQTLSPTGGNLGWHAVNPNPTLDSRDFDEYTSHCANYNYKFNPENNVLIDFSSQENNFADAANGDFTLLSDSPAKSAGIEIPGITSSTSPDCGALEGSNRVLNAGAVLSIPIFLENTTSIFETQFTISATSETCPNKNNGMLNIVPNTAGDYEITFNDNTYEFSTEQSFENIAPGNYDICINQKGKSEKQCYSVEIEAANEITSKSVLKNKTLEVNITKGTAPYKVLVNGTQILETASTVFSIDVNQGDAVEIKTGKKCEGKLIKSIDFYTNIQAFPNPTTGKFHISLPINEGIIPIEVYDIRAQLISSKIYTIRDGDVNIDLQGKPSGIYFAKLVLEQPLNIKIVKK